MILSDGTDTREEVQGHGPICDGMAAVLESMYMNGSYGDYYGNPDAGESAVVYGRRILWTTGTGFVSSSRHESEEVASAVAADAFPYDENDDY